MAKLKIEGLLEELEAEFKKAISSTLRVHFDPEQYTDKEVYKTFQTQLKNKCDSWETIPNKYIKS